MDYKESQDDSESAATSDESEEESEIDEESSENRRVECLTTLKELESHFSKLKEELINEKLRVIENKLHEIENETAKEFTIPLAKLKDNMDTKMNIATLLKEYRLNNVEHTFLCDEASAKQSFENDKNMLYDNLKAKIEREIKETEENRRLLYLELKKKEDLHESMHPNSNLLANKRKNQQKSSVNDEFDRKKRPTTVSGPFIVYSLPEWDILEDWSIMKKVFENDKVSDT